jgi:hypothetical protein
VYLGQDGFVETLTGACNCSQVAKISLGVVGVWLIGVKTLAEGKSPKEVTGTNAAVHHQKVAA